MADVLLHDAVVNGSATKSARTQVFVSGLVGYQFYAEGAANDLVYKKTTDGGATWATAVSVSTRLINAFEVYYDKWTPGITGTRIHIGYVDDTTAGAYYNYLDTASDTLGTEVTVLDSTSAVDTRIRCSIATMRGGNLLFAFNFDDAESAAGLYRSVDNGENWTSRTITGLFEGDGDDAWILFPGNEADNQDAWILFADNTGNAISLKVYDDSGDTTAETAIAAMDWTTASSTGFAFAGAVRHSDNHLIVAFFTERDQVTADLKVYDIASTASITALTDVMTDKDDTYNPCICIDQSTDDIYVGYLGQADGGETLGTSVTPHYQKSDDDGATWGGEVTYGETARNHQGMTCDPGGSAGTRFIPVFRGEGNTDLYVNFTNSVALGTPAPTLDTITPATGPRGGGTAVTLAGSDFVDAPTVTIGGASATSVVFVNSTSVTAVTPAGTPGAKDVVLTNPDAQADTLTGGFTYTGSGGGGGGRPPGGGGGGGGGNPGGPPGQIRRAFWGMRKRTR